MFGVSIRSINFDDGNWYLLLHVSGLLFRRY
jgi:hypothetical protein